MERVRRDGSGIVLKGTDQRSRGPSAIQRQMCKTR